MDQETLVAELRKLRNRLAHQEGPIALLMLLGSAEDPLDSWNVVVSAKGFDRESRAQALKGLTELLRETLDKAAWPQISRATVLPTDDPFVRALNSAFSAENAAVRILSTNVSGYEISRAILLESKRLAA